MEFYSGFHTISDAGVSCLVPMSNSKSVFLWKSQVSVQVCDTQLNHDKLRGGVLQEAFPCSGQRSDVKISP